MNENEKLIQNLYQSFDNRNAEEMGSAYAENAKFSDPVFPDLTGREIFGMWSMLLENLDPEGKITCESLSATDTEGSARWTAIYKFSKTGRTIHNRINATFRFENGKIVYHKDEFSLYRWARMAFGFKGLLLGWTSGFKKKVREETAKTLKMYMKRRKIK